MSKRPFDLTGPAGEAWKAGNIPDGVPTLCAYTIHRPKLHPFWEWWLLSVVHLRETEGMPPAILQYPEAEYELTVMALQPDFEPDPDAKVVHYLTPIDQCQQWHGTGDEGAAQIGQWAAEGIVNGVLLPDSDFRRQWDMVVPLMAVAAKEGRENWQTGETN